MSLKEKVRTVVQGNNLMHLATIDADGMPCVRGVDFAASEKENVLYFVTSKESRKVGQIQRDHNVAIAIDRDCPRMSDLASLVFIKATGTATLVKDPAEAQMAMGLLIQKFPFFKDLPGDPATFVPIRVALEKVLVTDNNVTFAHTEEVTY